MFIVLVDFVTACWVGVVVLSFVYTLKIPTKRGVGLPLDPPFEALRETPCETLRETQRKALDETLHE